MRGILLILQNFVILIYLLVFDLKKKIHNGSTFIEIEMERNLTDIIAQHLVNDLK